MWRRQVACSAILESLEKRWANSDQDVFVAAVILNPFFKHTPFKPLPCFRPASIHGLFVTLWERFFPGEIAPLALHKNVLDYLREEGELMALGTTVAACLQMSEQKVTYLPIASLHSD